jgi:hypothetical protein
MGMKRTTVFADEEDLAVLKAAAARRGVAEAELLREAIHLVALAERRWSEPFFSQVYERNHDEPAPNARDALEDAWSDKAAEYERSREVRH